MGKARQIIGLYKDKGISKDRVLIKVCFGYQVVRRKSLMLVPRSARLTRVSRQLSDWKRRASSELHLRP